MKRFRISLIMSGAIFAALGPLEYAAGASEPATSPFGPDVVPLSYQQGVQLPPVAPSVLDSLKSSSENNRRQQTGLDDLSRSRLSGSEQEHRHADAMLNSAGGCAEKQVRQESMSVGAHRDQ